MHDKTVRRRRAVLGLLVALSLILLSVSFGASSGGPLNTIQSGFLDVLSPIETGAHKVLTPVRDLFGWVGDIVHATNQRDTLRREVRTLRSQLVAADAKAREYQEGAALANLDREAGTAAYGPVFAREINRSSGLFVEQVTIDRGRNSGVEINDPVIDGDGVVGVVSASAATSAIVTLLIDPTEAVAARDDVSGALGVVQPESGSPDSLVLNYANPGNVNSGDPIVTAGGGASLFPPNIPIGTVSNVSSSSQTGQIDVTAAADFGSLDEVEVLTTVHGA